MSYQLFQYMLEPTLNYIHSKSNSKLEINFEENLNIIKENLNIIEENDENDTVLLGSCLKSSDIDKISGIILSINNMYPDFSYIEPSLNKSRYSKLRKTARSALKKCTKSESKIMNRLRITLINGCQMKGYSSNICNSLCKKLTYDINNHKLFKPQVINHINNLYSN